MALCLGGDVWHGDSAPRIDRHDCACPADDELAPLPDPRLVDWSLCLGPPRRFDSARPRPDDHFVYRRRISNSRLTQLTRYLIGFGSLFVFYLLFNLAVGGTPMPNTFYAKQAEYTLGSRRPFLDRLGQMSLQLLVGPSLVLIPGIIGWLVKSIRQKMWGSLAALIWTAGYLILYISRLPVYQHGRYIMPAMPIFFLFGLLAFAEFDAGKMFARYHWIGQVVWRGSIVMLSAAFIFLGAQSYAKDVALIESEMVVTAKWAATNLPPDALIAAHDIGALGYFDDHQLIDLAGLSHQRSSHLSATSLVLPIISTNRVQII